MNFYLIACLYLAELIFLLLGSIYLPINYFLMESNDLSSQELLIKLKPFFIYSLSALFCLCLFFIKKYPIHKNINLLFFGRNLSKYDKITNFVVNSFLLTFILLSLVMLLSAQLLSTEAWINTKFYFGIFTTFIAPIAIALLLSKNSMLNEFNRYLDDGIITKSRKLVLISLPCLFIAGIISGNGKNSFTLIVTLLSYVAYYYWIKLTIIESSKNIKSSTYMLFFVLGPIYALFFFKKLNDNWLLAFRDTIKLFIYIFVSIAIAMSGVMLTLPNAS